LEFPNCLAIIIINYTPAIIAPSGGVTAALAISPGGKGVER
jgi:hypothetical protein